jgi:murein DD-endopeptidase MepM/ murein hydrolase activator NlpD
MKEAAEESLSNVKLEILEKEEEYDAAKEKEYQDWLASQNHNGKPSVDANGITWLVPINYTYFSSPYGERWHPVYGGWRMHHGVDLSAPMGTPIIASRSGVVNVASYEEGGAGNYVNIDHKDGFVTRYMHMTHYIVEVGQYVYAGQVIGYCGSTGASTGPHLHFGIYYNGSSVNPAYYIDI